MYVVYGEACFSEKMFTNGLNMVKNGFATMNLSQKDIPWSVKT